MSEPQPTPAGQDRRAWVRYRSKPETPYYAISESEEIITWKARVRDISQGGISLQLNSSFDKDALVEIELPAADGARPRLLEGRVVRAEPVDDIQWLIACAFSRKLSEDELQSLLNVP